MLIENKLLRKSVFLLGCTSLLLGAVGVVLPILPTTPFLLLSAWSFIRSSPKAHQWIYRHPHLGGLLRDWEERSAIAMPAKSIALAMIAISLLVIWLKLTLALWLQGLLTVFLLFVSGFIASRPHK